MLTLRPFEKSDMPLFKAWLYMPHVRRWYHDPDAWLAEAENADGAYGWIRHFIVTDGGAPVGFCQYYAYAKSGEDWHGDMPTDGVYSIDYLIGDANALRKGFGRAAVSALLDFIRDEPGARRVIAQPERDNAASRGLLSACGFLYDADKDVFILDL